MIGGPRLYQSCFASSKIEYRLGVSQCALTDNVHLDMVIHSTLPIIFYYCLVTDVGEFHL